MKVFELIQALQALDPQLEVVVNGYEGGFNNCMAVSPITTFVENYHNEESWYYGRHEGYEYVEEYCEHTQEELSTLTTFKGVVIY